MQKRRRFKQAETLEERLTKEAERLRQQAQSLPPGLERDQFVRKAREIETASHMSDWLRAPGVQPSD